MGEGRYGSWSLRATASSGHREGSTQITGSSRISSGRTSWHRWGSPRRRCAAPSSCGISPLRAGRCCRWSSSRRGRWGWSLRRCAGLAMHCRIVVSRLSDATLNSARYADSGTRGSRPSAGMSCCHTRIDGFFIPIAFWRQSSSCTLAYEPCWLAPFWRCPLRPSLGTSVGRSC